MNERVRDAVAKGHEKVENLQKSGKLEELGEGINKLAANAGKLKEGIKGKLENVKLPGGIKLPTTPVTSTPTGAPLPAGWAWAKDGDGVPYYFNKSTNVVTYEDPRKGPPPPPPPPPPEEPEAAVDVSDAAGGGGGYVDSAGDHRFGSSNNGGPLRARQPARSGDLLDAAGHGGRFAGSGSH